MDSPEALEKDPGVHCSQTVSEAMDTPAKPNVPGLHAMPLQEVAPFVTENNPDRHIEHVLEPPDRPYCPVGHEVQKEAPVEPLNIPAEHGEQTEEPVELV